jgi:hypothetical protein
MRKSVLDDVDGIYEGIQRLRKERGEDDGVKPGTIQPPCDTEQPRLEDYACGWRPIVYRPLTPEQRAQGIAAARRLAEALDRSTAAQRAYDKRRGSLFGVFAPIVTICGEETDGA